MNKIIPTLSKMWLKVIHLEQSFFPELQSSLGALSSKEEKLNEAPRPKGTRYLLKAPSLIVLGGVWCTLHPDLGFGYTFLSHPH